ncbi:hypothetical protein, partial [Heyndrickxia coagulans]|uniref:hypothetical protein n=1 Tax=Heyndrickxia coagulans TaxID=1398 RepID=UPI003D1BCD14
MDAKANPRLLLSYLPEADHKVPCELPTTYQPYGLIEVGASRLIVAFTSQRKLTELTLLFQE